jgi:hypothetical protein
MQWQPFIEKSEDTYSIPTNWIYIHYFEALNLLFRVENALRMFVYVILKNTYKNKWLDQQVNESSAEKTIRLIADARSKQARCFGYLCHQVNCPILHLTTGELVRMIASEKYWVLFEKYFPGKKEIISNKMEEITTIRNSLAHFRPIKIDDIEVLKQNTKQIFSRIGVFLEEIVNIDNPVASNTTDKWYSELLTIGKSNCCFSLHEDKRREWINIRMRYSLPQVQSHSWNEKRSFSFTLLNLETPNILIASTFIHENCIYIKERISYPKMQGEQIQISKLVDIVFSKKCVEENHEEIKKELEKIVLALDGDEELIREDISARGLLLSRIKLLATYTIQENRGSWKYNSEQAWVKLEETHPPEYWGNLNMLWGNFPTDTEEYPWMPTKVSKGPSPF